MNRVRRDIGKEKEENSTEHRAIGHDRIVGKMKRATEVKKEICDLSNRRTRHKVTLSPTPSTIR